MMRTGLEGQVPCAQEGAAQSDAAIHDANSTAESVLMIAPSLLRPVYWTFAALVIAAPSFAQEMVRVPAGTFTMGSDDGPADERPAHGVTLREFEIDRMPVTNAQFAVFLQKNGAVRADGLRLYDWDDNDARIHQVSGAWRADAGAENQPVIEASWLGALEYCRSLGKRLPTEAEWEKAARGRYGAIDMLGKVWQWVSSAYRPYPYRADDGREDAAPGPVRGTRGGSYDSPPDALRASERGRNVSRGPSAGHHNIGFRCAR
jgi:formylglycine-generating enzyme required for sulfatase activity